MNDYILLSGLLSNYLGTKEEIKIHDIKEVEGLIYFKVNNHQFQTTGSWAYHKNHPMYDLAPTKIYAKSENTIEGVEKKVIQNEEFNKKFELWTKHRASLYKIVFIAAFNKYKDDPEKWLDYIEHHFFITEESDNCQKLISMLEDKEE